MLANLAALGMILVTLPKTTPGFEHSGLQWGPTVKTTDDEMQPLAPERLDAEAMRAFFHHGANIALSAARLRGIELAAGNRWPTPEDRSRRAQAEAERPADKRLPHPADPAALLETST
jgi:NAD(P)H dehydrogenase (quinone)